MDQLLKILTTVDNWLWGNWLLFVLIGVGILYTVITGFVQVRHFPYIIRKSLIEPLMGSQKDSQESGSISSFQALCTAVASCVGSGNIVGVSTAVLTGGLGAIFWMWVAAFVGMATKYGEIILGLMYREKDENGAYVGGPMYYIKKGLHAPWLAVLCAIFMITQIIGGNFIQSNTISGVMHDNFQIPHLVTGIVLVILIFTITLGGLKRLAHVTQKLVPIMATIYVIGGLLIILANITNIPGVLVSIIRGAFGLDAVAGGAIGSMIIAMQRGVARGLYSNEAGEGSAPVIHSAANVNHPAEQGMTGVIEVFLDTFVICTITGLVLGVTGILDSGAPANVIVTYAFASVWPPLKYLVAISLLLFSSTTLMSQWYFGFVGLNYLFGRKVAEKFKYVFPLFCVIGAVAALDLVWTIQDIALGLLTIPNLIAIVILCPKVHKASKEFWSTVKQ
ncbi:MAG TPA: sodium:alanine symporter family protein [Candidatus Caccovicinus merdipullorum]|uniref:Sodium:alanine symporter family protein n=1 Tax=Candidatus Caccovicinus merdipullorum TaxID=2840724 RepID=A0A9D1GIX8_9FIRM|nr:sodium:alanine symporter family protein [Candidatus Caccovicinus merdipullorum]